MPDDAWPVRDAAAMLESWDALARTDQPLFVSDAFRQIRLRLQQRPRRMVVHTGFDVEVAQVLGDLRALTRDVQHWKLPGKGFGLLAAGFRRTYADGVRDLARAQRRTPDELLHEWRKRAKDHWYTASCCLRAGQTRWKLARNSSSRSPTRWVTTDLAVMTELMQGEPELFGTPDTREAVQRCIEQRRAQLQQRALRLGRRLYAEPPKALAERVGAYWRIARKESE